MNILLPIYGFEIKTRYEASESISGTQKTQKRFLELHFPTKCVDFSQSYISTNSAFHTPQTVLLRMLRWTVWHNSEGKGIVTLESNTFFDFSDASYLMIRCYPGLGRFSERVTA